MKALALCFTLYATTTSGDLASKIDAYLKPYIDLNVFSGVVLLAKGDQIVFEKGYGMANYEFGVPNRPDTRYSIASITKRFTGIIVQRLIEEKKLSASDTLFKWAPGFPAADKITVQHLLTHYSGIQDPEKLRRTIRANRTTAEVVELLKVEPLASEPGATYSYTTANYAILAHIIERVTGQTYAAVVKKYVYDPAGMKDSGELTVTTVVPRLATGYMPDPFGHGMSVCGPEDTSWKAGGGSSYSTARDLHRFMRALYGGKLLPGTDATTYFAHSTTLEKKSLSSSGSFPGASANLLAFPDDQVTVVVMSNNYSSVPGTITQNVAAMYFGREVPIPTVKLAANPSPIDSRLAGSYEVAGPWKFTLSLHDGKPVISWTEIRQSVLLRMDDRNWFSPFDWATFELAFDEKGAFVGGMTFPGQEKLTIVRK